MMVELVLTLTFAALALGAAMTHSAVTPIAATRTPARKAALARPRQARH